MTLKVSWVACCSVCGLLFETTEEVYMAKRPRYDWCGQCEKIHQARVFYQDRQRNTFRLLLGWSLVGASLALGVILLVYRWL